MFAAARRGALTIAGLAALGLASAAGAAQQGTTGASSTGSIVISASVPVRAALSGVTDIAIGKTDTGAAALSLCLVSNSPSGGFTLNARGGGPDGALAMADQLQAAPYRVAWSGEPRAGPNTALLPATDPGECAAGQGAARLTVSFDPAVLSAAPAHGPYTGTLILTVVPQ